LPPASFEAPKFGHFDEQSESGDYRDAGNGEENLEAACKLRVIFDALFDGGVDLLDFHVDLGEPLFVLPFKQRKRDRLGAVFGRGAVFDQRGAGQMQLLQLGDGFADAGARLDLQDLAHARQHGGVGAIGFDQLAGGFGEAARLARIDLGDRQADAADARAFFDAWRAQLRDQDLAPYEKFASMIDSHWDGIAAHSQPTHDIPLGFVEGLNNKIRVIQRRAYGLRDEEYLRLKILTSSLPEL
jgi:hypothetical protein